MKKEGPAELADDFIRNETQFHLGAMVTEQSHPRSRGLSQLLAADTKKGVEMLLQIDDDIPPVLDRLIESAPFAKLCADVQATLARGGRIFFSGCGATGRLSILLDAAHRRFWDGMFARFPELKQSCAAVQEQTDAVMTGGDFALIRSVESFEDYIAFGARQLQDAGVCADDLLVAISEGGETSSVIGTIHAGLDAGAAVHFLFDNPAELLCEKVERSRRVISDPRVSVLDLTTGPMAVAGSTRMQATTIELIVAGTAFEIGLDAFLREKLSDAQYALFDFESISAATTAARFKTMLEQLRSEKNLAAMADYVDFEADIYRRMGRVTYFADDYLIDIFTDTTERAPTFKTPPFRSSLDAAAPAPWAFVKDPRRDSKEAWLHLLMHEPRCITWRSEDYSAMNAPERIIENPPKLDRELLFTFKIGDEPDASRTEVAPNAAVAVLIGDEIRHFGRSDDPWYAAFRRLAEPFETRTLLAIGPTAPEGTAFSIQVDLPQTPLDLFGHLAVKLALNNISTASIGKIGRLSSNWMAHVDASNKKLIDRSVRLIVELAGVDYRTACVTLFETLEEMKSWPEERKKTVSPAAWSVEKLLKKKTGGASAE